MGGSPLPVLSPLRLKEELSLVLQLQGGRDLQGGAEQDGEGIPGSEWPVRDPESGREGRRAACCGPDLSLGSEGASEGVKSPALELLEHQRKPGEINLVQ